MLILKPSIRMVGEEGDKKPVVQRIDEKFSEDDLIMDCLSPRDEDDANEVEDDTVDVNDSSDDEDWLSAL